MIKKDKSWVSPTHLMVTIYAGLLFLACACVNAGMTNTILPAICELRGWNHADALPFMSYGGYIGAAATILFAQLVVKKDAKFVTVLGLILGGVCLALYGYTTSFPIFLLCIIGNRVFSCAYQQAGCTALLNNWFPRKKGVVLGWATMGIILSDVIWSPYIPDAISAIGAPLTMAIVGVVFLLLALFFVLRIKNMPEEMGCYPDNNSEELADLAASQAAMKAYRTQFTWKRLLRTPQVWQIGIAWGLLWMIAIAFVSQLVRRCTSLGYEAGFAVQVLQISSIVGLFGSWLFGWIDTRTSTKTSTTIYAVAIALRRRHRQSGPFHDRHCVRPLGFRRSKPADLPHHHGGKFLRLPAGLRLSQIPLGIQWNVRRLRCHCSGLPRRCTSHQRPHDWGH